MDKLIQRIGYAFIILSLAIVFLIIIKMAVEIVNSSQRTGDMATWIGAFGTVFTLASTIWIASRQTFEKRKNDMAKAQIAAGGMRWKILFIVAEIESILSFLPKGKAVTKNELRNLLTSLQATQLWGYEEIMLLVPLPNDCAIHIAGGVDSYKAACKVIEVCLTASSDVSSSDIDGIHEILSQSARFLKRSADECKIAAMCLTKKID